MERCPEAPTMRLDRLSSRLSFRRLVQSLVGELVDSKRVRVGRVVPYAASKMTRA
jgi:hypothetical protein